MVMPIKAEEEYTIVRGDTLTKIAKEYDVTVQELMDAKNLRSNLIFIGQKLVIPSEVRQVSKQSEIEGVEKPIIPEEIKEPPSFIVIKRKPFKFTGDICALTRNKFTFYSFFIHACWKK